MLDPLHAGHDDQVQDRALTILFPDLVRGLFNQAPHRLADLAARPYLKLFHRLLDPFDLHLGLLDVHLNAFAQRWSARHFQCFLHATQGLLFGAVGILQFFCEQFADFGFHLLSFSWWKSACSPMESRLRSDGKTAGTILRVEAASSVSPLPAEIWRTIPTSRRLE